MDTGDLRTDGEQKAMALSTLAGPNDSIQLRQVVACFADIESERVKRGVSIAGLARRAHVSLRLYHRWRRGEKAPGRLALSRLAGALGLCEPPRLVPPSMLSPLFRGLLAATSTAAGIEPFEALDAAEKASAGGVPGGFVAMRARREAIYLLVAGVDLPAAQIARELGVSRQAVSRMVAQVEAERDLAEVDRRLEKITAAMRAGA